MQKMLINKKSGLETGDWQPARVGGEYTMTSQRPESKGHSFY